MYGNKDAKIVKFVGTRTKVACRDMRIKLRKRLQKSFVDASIFKTETQKDSGKEAGAAATSEKVQIRTGKK